METEDFSDLAYFFSHMTTEDEADLLKVNPAGMFRDYAGIVELFSSKDHSA